ncbi:hypothetical protein LTR65_001917 [Meristemomyces frigidus]
MSSNKQEGSTHYTDAATGLKIEILVSQGNYTSWYRGVKVTAEGKDIWILIVPPDKVEEHEVVLTKPTRPPKPDAGAAKYQTKGAAKDEEIAAKQEVFRIDANSYQISINKYKLDAEAYKEQ